MQLEKRPYVRPYEVVILMHPDATEDDQKNLFRKNKAIVEEQFGGSVKHLDTWGKRSLANPIAKNKRAVFFHSTFTAEPQAVLELERTMRINHTLSLIPESVRAERAISLRPVEVLVIAPSERLDQLAAQHAQALPWPVRVLLRGIGAMNRRGGALTSYLLFERPYTTALIDLGYRDTMARADEVRDFMLPT